MSRECIICRGRWFETLDHWTLESREPRGPMTTQTSSRRTKNLRRRFSSASSGGWPGALEGSHSRGRPRQISLSPPGGNSNHDYAFLRPTLTDASDDEIESDFVPSVASDPHIFRGTPSRPMIYASLPPTPISRSPTVPPQNMESPISPMVQKFAPQPDEPFSLWDYLREELLATDFDSHQELKWERVSNFLQIPVAMEKV